MTGRRRATALLAILLIGALVAPAGVLAASGATGPVLHPTGLTPTPGLTSALTATAEELLGTMTVYPDSIDLSAWAPPVGNQGSVGSCTSWATGYYERYWLRNRALDDHTIFAPMFLYSQITGGQNVGTSFPSNFSYLINEGIPPQSVYWQGTTNYWQLPDTAEHTAALPYRATSYSQLFGSSTAGKQQLIQAALANGKTVMLGIPVYPEFDRASVSNPVIDVPVAGETSRGGHAVFVAKYDTTGAWIENSWGTGWGASGWGDLTWAFIQGYAFEGWTLDSSSVDVSDGTVVIQTLAPASGPVGTTVTVTGTGFTGATDVALNGTTVAYSLLSDTQLTFTVPAGSTTGSVTITGPVNTATSPSPFTVTAPTTSVRYSGATSVIAGQSLAVAATLTSSGGTPIPGATVRFSMAGGTATGTTNASGVATATMTAPAATGTYPVAVAFDGDATWAASSASASVKVTTTTTTVRYTGLTTLGAGAASNELKARLTTKSGTPIAGMTVRFSVAGVVVGTGTTDATGIATLTVTGLTKGTVKVTVAFAGATGYGAASSSTTVKIL